MKILSFTVLLAVVVFVNYYMLAMAKKGRAPDPTIIEALPMHAWGSLVLVLLEIENTTTA